MGFPRPDSEKNYLDAQLGTRWQRILVNGQTFNWFADFASHESKVDRDKLVKRLRVFASRDESPTAFWMSLINKFYDEGAHLGLRKYVEDGVTYYCPPQFFVDFKGLCQSAPSYKNTLYWVFQPEYTSGRIYAHVFCPGIKNWFKLSWPDTLMLRDQRYSVFYYPAGAVNVLADADDEEDFEECLDGYRSTHSVLCLIFNKKSSAAHDIPLDPSTSESILEVVADPYLAASSGAFNSAALEIAGLCLDGGKNLESSPVKEAIVALLAKLGRDYPQLEAEMVDDTDYLHLMTYRLMPLPKKSTYASLMADFEAGMKMLVIEHADEISVLAQGLTEHGYELNLYVERKSDEHVPFSKDVVREYLSNSRSRAGTDLAGFDTLLDISDSFEEDPTKTIRISSLKQIVKDRYPELSEDVDTTGEFLITGPLMIGLMEVGQVRTRLGATDYGDFIYRTGPDRPWLRAPVKFAGETEDLERVRSEFLAFCRIITGK